MPGREDDDGNSEPNQIVCRGLLKSARGGRGRRTKPRRDSLSGPHDPKSTSLDSVQLDSPIHKGLEQLHYITMAVTVEERLRQMRAARMAAIASSYPATSSALKITKRRAASSATATAPEKRRKDSKSPRKSRSTSTPSTGRRKSSTPSGAAVLARPVERTPAPHAGVPALPRTYLDFSHFLRTMEPEARKGALAAIQDAGVDGEERWRGQHYDPLYATESCKLAFLLQTQVRWEEKKTEAHGERKTKARVEESEMREHPCYRCYTLQPKGAFEVKPHHILISPRGGLSMHAHDKDLPAIRQGERLLRQFCIECGVRDGLYPNRSLIYSMAGDRWWVCECRQLHWASPDEPPVECRRCLGTSGFRSPVPEAEFSVSSGGFSPQDVGNPSPV
ncbi:hypothetical protein LZ30DRAFT_702374 [Colletotrichum cereale]|nr:hypothetical protein LZ30DRAFT_702374 [Colletotrichum cereale]